MNDPVPEQVASALAQAVIRSRRPAFVTADSEGCVLRWGGSLSAYGVADLRAGSPIAEQIPFLTGLLPLTDSPAEWFRMQTEGVFADVHLVPHGAEDWVILLDSQREARGEVSVQQLRNELQLVRESAQGGCVSEGTGSDAVEGIFAALGKVALSRRDDGAFSLIGDPPEWAIELFSLEVGVDVVRPVELSPFLEHFLLDAETHWYEGRLGELRSGAWQELNDQGETVYLEASAIALPRCSLLLIERLGAQHHRAAATLQKAREARLQHYELLRELEEKEVLLHTIVHDLSGPATAMQGFLQLVSEVDMPDNLRRLSATAMRQSQRQQEMIAEILDVFAAERQEREFHFDLEMAPNVVACVREAVESMAAAYARRGVRVRYDPAWVDLDSIVVVGEKSRLDRVLFNLLENALRYSPRDSTVTVGIVRLGETIRVFVDDEGSGVAPDVAEHLFEKMAQGRSGEQGKAGLGLYFCRLMMDRWGGAIGCETRPRGGARFWFELKMLAGAENIPATG